MCEKIIDSDDFSLPKDIMTSLPDGSITSKSDLCFEACGAIDELNSFIGLLVNESPIELHSELQEVQRKLFAVGAFVVGVDAVNTLPSQVDVSHLKDKIKSMKQITAVHLDGFVIPGGCHAAALSHVCRTVCRRAERICVRIKSYQVVPYLNRLSTYFFYLALYLNYIHNTDEIKL